MPVGKYHRIVKEGKYRTALEYSHRLLIEVRAEGKKVSEVYVLSLVADAYARLGQYRQNLKYLNEALVIAREIGTKGYEGAILTKLVAAYSMVGDNKSAADCFEAAVPLLEETPQLWHLGPELVSNFANVLSAEGLYAEALDLYDQALEKPFFLQPGTRIEILNNKGNIQFLKEDYSAALKLYKEALTLAQKRRYPAVKAESLVGIGSVHEKEGRLEEARIYYERGINELEKVLKSVGAINFRISLLEQHASIYRRLVPLLFRMGQKQEAFELCERARARTFLDQMAIGQLDDNSFEKNLGKMAKVDLFRSKLMELKHEYELKQGSPGSPPEESQEALKQIREQIISLELSLKSAVAELEGGMLVFHAMASADIARLPDIQKTLDADTTLLSYFVTDENTLAFVITNDSFHALALPIGEKQLKEAIVQLDKMASSEARIAVEVDNGIYMSLETSLRELSQWLIAPVARYLNTEKIGIVSHGVLNYLPFAAINDGKGYFGDRHSLFSLPSASMLAYMKPTTDIGRRALIMAQQDVKGFAKLTFAVQEAHTIAKLYRTQTLSGDNATETTFHERAGQSDIIHLAAHGELNPVQPLFSRIMLGEDSMNDGSLEVHEVYGLDLRETDLVVLSACDTQLGPLSRGDDFIGLSRAFLAAGASAVVASLWPVDDEATSFLMSCFYSNLNGGMSMAASLSAAQKTTRDKYFHPYYWAAFILTGNPKGSE
jgi:CHAT domain-containing protein